MIQINVRSSISLRVRNRHPEDEYRCPLYPQKRTLHCTAAADCDAGLLYAVDNGWLEVTPTERDMQRHDMRMLTAAGFAQIQGNAENLR